MYQETPDSQFKKNRFLLDDDIIILENKKYCKFFITFFIQLLINNKSIKIS